MSPVEARLVLALAECRRDWELVARQLVRARGSDPAAGEAQAALVALSLDHASQVFKTLLLRLETALGLPARTGGGWHAALLRDAVLALPGLRPALYPPEAGTHWESLLRFRHFLRHAYALELDPALLAGQVERLAQAVALTDPWLAEVFDACA